MSSNRLIYDTCAYKKRVDESVGSLSYLLNPIKYENCSKCRHELGIVGGTSVSQISGNIVDLESDLRGQTRLNSQCPNKKYQGNKGNKIYINGNECGQQRTIDLDMLHLPPCQMIRYKPIPLPPSIKLDACPAPKMQSPNASVSAPLNPNCKF